MYNDYENTKIIIKQHQSDLARTYRLVNGTRRANARSSVRKGLDFHVLNYHVVINVAKDTQLVVT